MFSFRVIHDKLTIAGEAFGSYVEVALGYGNSRRAIAKLVDEGDVTKRYTPTTSGEQLMTFINESGADVEVLGSRVVIGCD